MALPLRVHCLAAIFGDIQVLQWEERGGLRLSHSIW